MKNLFNIYHPLEDAINHKCEQNAYQYQHVAVIEAPSLEDAYTQAQNDTNAEYGELGFRSTCVGDIITETDDSGIVTHYIVESFGFLQVPHTMLNYIDAEHDEAMREHLAKQMLDNPEDHGLI